MPELVEVLQLLMASTVWELRDSALSTLAALLVWCRVSWR